jgi:hypothetical protein
MTLRQLICKLEDIEDQKARHYNPESPLVYISSGPWSAPIKDVGAFPEQNIVAIRVEE